MNQPMTTTRRPATNERTRYELVATNGDRIILVGYTSDRGNRRRLLNFLCLPLKSGRVRLKMLKAKLGIPDTATWECAAKVANGIVGPNGWRIVWTGRTERDCASTGEQAESIYE